MPVEMLANVGFSAYITLPLLIPSFLYFQWFSPMLSQTAYMGVEVKTGRVDQACARYGVGRNIMRSIAEQSEAVIRIGRNYLIDFQRVDKYPDALAGNEQDLA